MCGVPKDWMWIFYLQTIQCKIRAQYTLDNLNSADVYMHESMATRTAEVLHTCTLLT